MGYYLNCSELLEQYESETKRPYFIDKTKILFELIPLVEEGNNNICITRPRRFGKSVMATMIGAFFGKGVNSSHIFNRLHISENPFYEKHLNQHELIYIDFSKMNPRCENYDDYIDDIIELLREDLHEAFPNVRYRQKGSASEDLKRIHQATGTRFIFVFDEWDFIFHRSFISDKDRKNFINFLADLTKGRGYVLLTYMTGIMPIAKYSSGSSMNHFSEYTMATQSKFGSYFGFTEEEVEELLERYRQYEKNPNITREELDYWYDGYRTVDGKRMYNPRSIVYALSNNRLASYWTSSGSYSEIEGYISNNISGVKKDIAFMLSGEQVTVSLDEYVVTKMNLRTREEIYSAMVVYGFLAYDEKSKTVYIPNKELRDEFAKTIEREKSFGYIYNLACASKEILEATLKCDERTVEQKLEFVHNTESPILNYNNETELSAVVNLAYLAARDKYRVEREDKAGKGYVDFIFYPNNPEEDCFIIELKVDATPEIAIQQIKDRDYAVKFDGKIAEKRRYTGRILAVGISYSTKGEVEKKTHHCKIEVLRM